jgi:hypothetical protein
MNSKNATDNQQDNQNANPQSSLPANGITESNSAQAGNPTPLQAWMQQELAARLQERRQQAALENLAAKLACHLATLKQETK